MAFSTQRAVSNGTLQVLLLSIKYIDKTDITVYVNSIETTAYTWASDTSIRLNSVVPNGQEVLIRRTTDMSKIRHQFTTGAQFKASTLDEDFQQILHISQEALEGGTVRDLFNVLNMHGYKISNLGKATADGDAVSLGQVKTESASAWVAAAEAKSSAAAALESKNSASASATSAADSKSSAIASANTASSAATTATTASSSARQSADAAAVSAREAAAANQSATSSAASASASEIAAADSEDRAAESARQAKVSETRTEEIAASVEDVSEEVLAAVGRTCVPGPTAPTTRADGSPLQPGDTYFNTALLKNFHYTGTEWLAPDIRMGDLANSTDPGAGAALIGFEGGTVADALRATKTLQNYTALRAYTGPAKLVVLTGPGTAGLFELMDTPLPDDGGINVGRYQRRYVGRAYASWFELKGDGSDESAKIRALVSTRDFELVPGKKYGFSGSLVIPEASDIVTHGAAFHRVETASGFGITVAGALRCDTLALTTPGGPTEGGIRVVGSDVYIDTVKFTSETVQCGYMTANNGLLVSATSREVLRVRLGAVDIVNHAIPTRFVKAAYVDCGRITGNDFITGCYISDVRDSVFRGGNFKGASPMAVGGPGQNGVLVESTTDYATRNLTIYDFEVSGAPEHGFRVGGQAIADNIRFSNCISRLSGSGTAPTGGSGFKVLGPNSRQLFHRNVFLINCVAEDSGQTSSGNNFNALAFAWVDGAQIVNFVASKNTKPFACNGGIILSHLRRVAISNPIVEFTRAGALRFFEEPSDTGIGMDDISVVGGVLHRAEDFDVITLECKTCVFRNINLSGTLVRGGRAAVRQETAGAGGGYVDCSLSFKYVNPTVTTGGPAITGGNDIMYDVTAPWYGTYGPPGANGSTWRDTTNGILKLRKSGNWVNL